MFFTQDDYKKIQQWLIKNSVKDTEFNEANIPFNGEETITIVQGNQNKKVFLKDLIAQVFNLGISDFVNITDKYDAPNISLEEAIRLIPSRARKTGQVITFLDTEDHWHIYQFKGVLNQWNVLDTWEDLFDFNINNFIIDSILPDEEDLTKSLPDANGNSYLSLKDREYKPEDFSGLGRVILRKNIVEIEDPIYGKDKKNILYQGMFTQANTIYEIRYDFDLGGNEITIPEGCVLDFQGGCLNNGTIGGNNTAIKAELVKIFGLDINLSGSWNVSEAYPEWFGAISDYNLNGTYTNNTPFFKKCADSFKRISLPIGGKYYLNETLYINGDTSIFGNNSYIVINETLDYGICITSNWGVIFNNAEIKDLTIHTNTQRPPVKQIYAFKIERNVNKHFNNIILQPHGIGFIYFGNDVWDIEINSCNCRSYESTWNCVMFTHHTNINIKFNDFHIEGYDTVFTTTLENFDQNIYLNTFVVGGLTKTIIDGNKGCLYVFINNFHIETNEMLGTQFKNANIVCTNGIYICTGILEEDIAYKCHITFNNVHFVGFSEDRYKKTKFSSSGTTIYNNCSSTSTLAPAPSNSVPFNGNLRLNSFSDINIGWSENPDDTAVASQPVYKQNDSISLNGYDTGIYIKIPNNWNTNRICVSFDVMRTNATAQATQLEVIGLCRDSKKTQVINRNGINITDRVLNDTYSTVKVLLNNDINAGIPDILKLVYISTFGGFQMYKIKNINIFPLNYYYN